MSWLQKALQRAMETQKNEEINLLSEKEKGHEPPEGETDQAEISDTMSPDELTEFSISYTQTRRIKTNKKEMGKNRLILQDRTDMALIEQYKLLRAQMFKRTEENQWRTIMITSIGKGEGKTLTAINLSLVIAQEVNQTVLLVDANIQKPIVLRLFGLEESNGLTDHFLKGSPISELLVNPGIDRFTILPGGKPIKNTAEVLRSPRMALLVKEMKERYKDRYIIFDVPPLLTTTDALVFSNHTDAIILVIEAGKTTKADLKKGWELLKGKNILGLVLNKCILDKKSSYLRYKYE